MATRLCHIVRKGSPSRACRDTVSRTTISRHNSPPLSISLQGLTVGATILARRPVLGNSKNKMQRTGGNFSIYTGVSKNANPTKIIETSRLNMPKAPTRKSGLIMWKRHSYKVGPSVKGESRPLAKQEISASEIPTLR